ncbi:MAG: cell division protein FtsL [Candidatus Manganitrophaceae bacterium]
MFRHLGLQKGGLLLGGLILLLAFLSLWQRNQMIHLGYEIEQFHRERGELQRVYRALQAEAESLSAVERIERIAVQQLKMVPALPPQRIYIRQTQDTSQEIGQKIGKKPPERGETE